MANISPCLVGIEACGGSHYWARVFESYGHTVKIMSPQFVKPQIRGLSAEYGVVIAKGVSRLNKLPEILEKEANKLSSISKELFFELYEQLKVYVERVAHYEKKIQDHAANDPPRCLAVQEIEGVGPITASAVVATIGEAKAFKNGREVSAWLGLTPRQHSSGNNIILGSITKRGDRYVRKLLVHGARAVVNTCDDKLDRKNQGVTDNKKRCGYNKATVALANKNARVIWAILATGECYRKTSLIETNGFYFEQFASILMAPNCKG